MYLLHHLLGGDDILAFEEPAFLGEDLIFDVDGGNARLLVLPDGAPYVDGIAIAGVGVAHHGHGHRIHDIASVLHHLRLGEEAHIGEALLSRSPGAGHIDSLKPGCFSYLGMKGVQDEGGNDHTSRVDELPEAGHRLHFALLTFLPTRLRNGAALSTGAL